MESVDDPKVTMLTLRALHDMRRAMEEWDCGNRESSEMWFEGAVNNLRKAAIRQRQGKAGEANV